jgi:hypothetical protein
VSFCLAAGAVAVRIAAASFSLAWTHTVEKTAWAEDWRVEGDRLVLVRARVQGSGAGMEPPPEARLENGFYVWEPDVPPLPEILLRRADQAGDWRLCAVGRCSTLGEWLGGEGEEPVRLRPCSE